MANRLEDIQTSELARACVIRPLLQNDFDCVMEMWSKTAHKHLALRYSNTAIHGYRDSGLRLCGTDREREITLGAFAGSTLVGMVTLVFAPAKFNAEVALIVRSDMQRCGLGYALTIEAANLASSRRLRAIWGQAFAENDPALKLSRRLRANIEHTLEALYLFRATLALP